MMKEMMQNILSMIKSLIIFLCCIIMLSTCDKTISSSELEGFWVADIDSTYMLRYGKYDIPTNTIYFKGSSIELPHVSYDIDIDFKGKFLGDADIDSIALKQYREAVWRSQEDAQGTFHIWHDKEDSIFIDTPRHPLGGKYKITIRKPTREYDVVTIKLVLENDSTYILCERNIRVIKF